MNKPVSLLVTGCSGFVGRALAARAVTEGYIVTGTSRQAQPFGEVPFRWVQMPDFADSDWLNLLQPIDIVVHCAARVHQLRDRAEDPLEAFRLVNVHGTRQLAEFAVRAGVQRFVLLSTIKVNGDHTMPGKAFRASDPVFPTSAYGVSKWEAEQALKEVCAAQLDWLIVRPPLVYGPAAKGNLALFASMAKLRLPLPLGHVKNQRSLISLHHLVQFLMHCLCCNTVNETVLIADKKPYTTAEIFTMVCQQGSCPARVLTLPKSLQVLMDTLLKPFGFYAKLTDSLAIDISDTLERMQWQPPEGPQ